MRQSLKTGYVALGGNLDSPKINFNKAINLINDSIGEVLSISSLYTTKALLLPGQSECGQPDYENIVLSLSTNLTAESLLEELLKIEYSLGRRRKEGARWESRPIDIDLLALENTISISENLTLPHPEIINRDFVLYPLQEISPDWKHPCSSKDISEIIKEFETSSRQKTIITINPSWRVGGNK